MPKESDSQSWINVCQKWATISQKKTRKAVDDLSRGIVNKLLHGPMQHLRCDGSDSRTLSETLENMHALNRMFNLETEISVLEQKIQAKVEQTQKESQAQAGGTRERWNVEQGNG